MPLRTPVSDKDHMEGSSSAAIELVEYGDYQCPYCQRAYYIVKKLQGDFGNQVKLVFRNFPLAKIHPDAHRAAIASEAADRQGKYWQMHDHLFENHTDFSDSKLVEFAGLLGLDTDTFKSDLDDPELSSKVEAHFYDGMRSGVNATPTFFINGEKFTGDWARGGLGELLEEILKE